MSRLTTKEKEHWRGRIAKRIDRAIDQLWTQEAGLKSQFEQAARKAVESRFADLPIRQHNEQVEKRAELSRRQKEAGRKETSLKRKVIDGFGIEVSSYSSDFEINDVYNKLMTPKIDNAMQVVMASHPTGKRIVQLKREKEQLLDTVWLATSTVQIKELWSKFLDVVEDEPTEMQRNAIEMPPVEGSEEK